MSEQTSWGASSVVVDTSKLPKFDILYAGQSEFEEPETFRTRRNAEIEGWLQCKKLAESAVETERTMRAKVTATLFPTPKKGTQRYELGDAYKIKLAHSFTYTIGDKDKEDAGGNKISIEAQIRELEASVSSEMGELGVQILKRLIRWKPELSGSEYEKLDKTNQAELHVKQQIDKLLTIKSNTPQLVFEEPKSVAQ